MANGDKHDWSHLEKLFRDYIEGRPMQPHWPQAADNTRETRTWAAKKPAGE